MPPECGLSDRLRQYLRWAGVERAELFANDATRKQITFHDLRATGITWMALRGEEPIKIMRRAGHENSTTTMGYVREAENLVHAVGDPFPTLPPALLVSSAESSEGPAYWAQVSREKTRLGTKPELVGLSEVARRAGCSLPAGAACRVSSRDPPADPCPACMTARARCGGLGKSARMAFRIRIPSGTFSTPPATTPAQLAAGPRLSKLACYYAAHNERLERDQGAGGPLCERDLEPGPTGSGRAPRHGAPDCDEDADRSGTASGERLLGAPFEAPEGNRAHQEERGCACEEREARHALASVKLPDDGGTGHEEELGADVRRGPDHGWHDDCDGSLRQRSGGCGARNRPIPRARDGDGDRDTQRAAEQEHLRRASRARGSRPCGESRDLERRRVQPRLVRRDPSLQARESCEAHQPC
jgi:hypothetical protein